MIKITGENEDQISPSGSVDILPEITHYNLEKSGIPEERSRNIILDETITKIKTSILKDYLLAVSTFNRRDINSTSALGENEDAAILGIITKNIKEKGHDLIIGIDITQLSVTLRHHSNSRKVRML